MQEFLRFFGHGFCHQIPARSFESGGLVFSACSRDTGIYLGFFFAVVAAFLIYARSTDKPTGLLPAPFIIALSFFIVPMAFDGVTSYLGLRPTTNTIRYITGFFAGAAGGTVFAPLLFALRADAAPQKQIFAQPSKAIAQLVLTFVLGATFFFGYPYLGVVSPFLAVAAFVAIIVSVNLVLLTLSKRFAVRHTVVHWLLLLAFCLVLALVEIALLGAIRTVLIQSLFGGHEFYEFLT
ncbi:MAG: DUF2085 domain-containing protein [Coriobacteriales bacterium]|jgi:uncharacterized membrane protein|nr:DUF2085 domain-containing protein [Coriobacteriales bacterium]